MYIYKYVRACVLQMRMVGTFCESYTDKIFVNLIVIIFFVNLMLIKRTIHGEAVVYVCDFQGIVLFT